MICRELHFVNPLQSANFLIGQTEKRYTYYDKYTQHIIKLLNQPCNAGKFLKIAMCKPGDLSSTRQTSILSAQW